MIGLAAGLARACLAVALHFLAAALFAFAVGRVYFSVARSAFPVACLWVGRERERGGERAVCERVCCVARGLACALVRLYFPRVWFLT